MSILSNIKCFLIIFFCAFFQISLSQDIIICQQPGGIAGTYEKQKIANEVLGNNTMSIEELDIFIDILDVIDKSTGYKFEYLYIHTNFLASSKVPIKIAININSIKYDYSYKGDVVQYIVEYIIKENPLLWPVTKDFLSNQIKNNIKFYLSEAFMKNHLSQAFIMQISDRLFIVERLGDKDPAIIPLPYDLWKKSRGFDLFKISDKNRKKIEQKSKRVISEKKRLQKIKDEKERLEKERKAQLEKEYTAAFHRKVYKLLSDPKKDIGIFKRGKTGKELVTQYKIASNIGYLSNDQLIEAIKKDQKDGRYYFFDTARGKYYSNLRHKRLPKALFTERLFTKKYFDRLIDELFNTYFHKNHTLIIDMVGKDEKMAALLGDNYIVFSAQNFYRISELISHKKITTIIPVAHFNKKGKMINSATKKEYDPQRFYDLAKKYGVKLFFGGCYSSIYTKGISGANIKINRKLLLEAIAKNLHHDNLGAFFQGLSDSFYREFILTFDIDLGGDMITIEARRKKRKQKQGSNTNTNREQESEDTQSTNEDVVIVLKMKNVFPVPISQLIENLIENEN